MSDIVNMNLSDIDFPVFTHTKEFRNHFDFIMMKIKEHFNGERSAIVDKNT